MNFADNDRVKSKLLIRELESSNVWNYENAFYWFSHPSRLGKIISHYELYKSIKDLPGDILEFGVYKGASLIRFATFRNILENDYSRKIVGFDPFGIFPHTNLTSELDFNFIKKFESEGGNGLNLSEISEVLIRKNFKNIELKEGNCFETLPKYLKDYPATRIALLHLDMDVNEPTTFVLEELYERIVPNGLIVIDDYNAIAGATNAIDSFIHKNKLPLQKLTSYSVPTFIRKPI
jgi:hypothetical protein